jgi:hypothetical protein
MMLLMPGCRGCCRIYAISACNSASGAISCAREQPRTTKGVMKRFFQHCSLPSLSSGDHAMLIFTADILHVTAQNSISAKNCICRAGNWFG